MRNRYAGMPRQDTPEGRAAYMRELRQRNRDLYERDRRRNRAHSRALWRLARLHPDEFDALVAEELARDETRDERGQAAS